MKKYPLKQKAYKINFDRIDEGYLSCEQISWAESIGKARKELMKRIEYDGWKLRFTGDEISYINIPVIRDKEHDLYEFEGKNTSMNEIDKILEERERLLKLEEILNDNTIKFVT